MFREKVFGRNGGVLCGASDTVQAVDDIRQEAAGHPPRQVRVLLLQSLPAAVLSDERAQVVSHFLRGVSPCKQVEMDRFNKYYDPNIPYGQSSAKLPVIRSLGQVIRVIQVI